MRPGKRKGQSLIFIFTDVGTVLAFSLAFVNMGQD